MKPSLIQFSKPKELTNAANPGAHFMRNVTYSAKEVMEKPYHANNQTRHMFHNSIHNSYQDPRVYNEEVTRRRDIVTDIPLSDIRKHNNVMGDIPIPVGMFMNMSHVPPRFFNKQQQAQQQDRGYYNGDEAGGFGQRRQRGDYHSQGNSQLASQEGHASLGNFTQRQFNSMNMTNASSASLSQGFSAGLSQNDFSQDFNLSMRSQQSQGSGHLMGGASGSALLSQDSTYQGDRFSSQAH